MTKMYITRQLKSL